MMEQSIEKFIFEFIDQCKLLFFPEQWNNTFMDYSKNEVFALFYVYRKGNANMSEIADYLKIPLNTATGIISRLEKRGLIQRKRDVIDKRVVMIELCPEGISFMLQQLKTLERYFHLFMDNITEEDKIVLIRLVGKFLEVMSQDLQKNTQSNDLKKGIRKITIE